MQLKHIINTKVALKIHRQPLRHKKTEKKGNSGFLNDKKLKNWQQR